MTTSSSPRASGHWRVLIVLLLLAFAFAFTAAVAPSARAGSAQFCPSSGLVSQNTGTGCSGPAAWLLRVSYFQYLSGTHCAVSKTSPAESSSNVLPLVCGAGYEIYTSTNVGVWSYPRGRNESGITDLFYGISYW